MFKNVFGINLPFLPIYGCGLVIIYLIHHYLKNKNLLVKRIIYGISLTFLEFVGEWSGKLLFDIDLWDYSSYLFHLGSYVGLIHTFFGFF